MQFYTKRPGRERDPGFALNTIAPPQTRQKNRNHNQTRI